MTNVKKGQVDFYFIFDKKNIPVFFDNENQNILEYNKILLCTYFNFYEMWRLLYTALILSHVYFTLLHLQTVYPCLEFAQKQ